MTTCGSGRLLVRAGRRGRGGTAATGGMRGRVEPAPGLRRRLRGPAPGSVHSAYQSGIDRRGGPGGRGESGAIVCSDRGGGTMIQVQDLTKTFSDVTAVGGIT